MPVAATHTQVAAIEGRVFEAAVTVRTQFHGDSPATMEATHADGTDVDPADWTPYQQCGYLFSNRAVRQGDSSLAAQRRSPGRDEPSPDRRGAGRTLRVDAVGVA
ncbi:hypothetical protein ACIGDI_32655 [Streptomyces sp. NPDC085900]|uniref:hypothetical protein n=1 Tax=Streptomyces sp. NPDC085900 TaxID=3365737 RepID=UPI0037D310AA